MKPTTLGQILVNDALPEKFRDYNRVLTKGEADALLGQIAKEYPERYKNISWQLIQLGKEAAFTEGSTLKLSDLQPVFDKTDLLKHVEQQEKKIRADKTMTDEEKQQTLEGVYTEVQKLIVDQTYDSALANNNPFAIQVKSKARGNKSQLTALLSTPSVYQDAQDRTVPVFIRRSYSEGLEPHEYWASTYGARKAILSTKFSVREAGALGKQLGVAVSNLVVTQNDCGTPAGIPVPTDDNDSVGAVLARNSGKYPAGTVITKEVLADMKQKKTDEVVVRSPITCSLAEGVCKHCAGVRENGKFPEIGYHLGLNASSALAERIAQGQLNKKHSGGQTDPKGHTVYAGFDVINNLAQVPKNFPNRATVAEQDGTVDKIEEAPQGGWNVIIDNNAHYVPADRPLLVKEGDPVEQGDTLSEGIVNPADAVRLKGIGEGRRYFAERFTKAFRESDFEVNRRNVEAVARAAIDHVSVDDPEGVGDFLPGDIISYSGVAHSYRPRADAKQLEPIKAKGMYLEQPALHYTIGTRVTGKMTSMLKKHGVDSVIAHSHPAGFSSTMVGITKVPAYSDDWMARLGSTYLESRLLEDIQRGAKSNIHGLEPLPGIAKGVEFGKPKGSKFTY